MLIGLFGLGLTTAAPFDGVPVLNPPAYPPGYFRVEEHQGVWWLVDPDGHATLSIGIDNVTYDGDRILGSGPSPYQEAADRRYHGPQAWIRAAMARLHGWGFNTLGAWSDEALWSQRVPYTVILDFAARSGAVSAQGWPADVFDPRFKRTATAIAAHDAAPRSHDRMLVGYFSDNELWWGTDWRHRGTVLGAYLEMAPTAPGRRRAVQFLRARYQDNIAALDRAWGVAALDFWDLPAQAPAAAYRADADAFLALVAERYFAVSAEAIHRADPNHLYLGARFVGLPPTPVLVAARAADVVSLNLYDRDPRAAVERSYAVTGRPILISEFSFRALDSGLPNTVGAGPWVFNEWTRAWAYVDYVTRLESLPEAIGYHWFRWADEPRQGRGDGENSNYGLVSLGDDPYAGFVAAVAITNRAAADVHRGAEPRVLLPQAFAWYHWSWYDILGVLLGGPRWIVTAGGAVRAYLGRQT